MIDDGSTDNTVNTIGEIAKHDNRISSRQRPDHIAKGASACRNWGVTFASGEFIQYFDSDDLMEATHLEKKLEAIRSDNADVVVSQLSEVFVETGKERTNSIRLANGISDLIEGKANWYVCGPMWRAETIEGVKFPEEISNLDDLVFNLRCYRRIKRIAYIDEPLIRYMRHANGITGAFSQSSPRELISTLRARETIGTELEVCGLLDRKTSAALLKSYAHLGYLIATQQRASLLCRYLKGLLSATVISTLPSAICLVCASLFWSLTKRGYFLVRLLSR